jgi:hypothetical protein
MGMFDTIRCERELPGDHKPPPTAWLQTKSLECCLDTFTITANGRLVGPYGDIDYHGFIHFGAYHDQISYEYRAKFTDGNLVELTSESVATLNDDGEWVPVPALGEIDGR